MRQVLPSGSRRARPMLLRLRKNSTSTTAPSGSAAVAAKSALEAVVAVPGTPETPVARVNVILGARPTISLTTTRRDPVLVPCTVPTDACVVTVYVSGLVGVQIAR